MPLNYSKWDALELSDDSDIECHPNVDKRSFIRLKQRQIHQQREERKQKIELLQKEATMNAILLERMGELIAGTQKEGANYLRKTASQLSAEGHAQAPSSDQQPTIDQMVFNLITQILTKVKDSKNPSDQDEVAQKELAFHSNRLSDRESKRKVELETEEAEAKKHITSEDIHDGFDVSHIDKKPSAAIDEPITATSKPKSIKKVKKTNVEVLNPKSAGMEESTSLEKEVEENDDESEDSDDEELPKLSASAAKFAKIKSNDYSSSLSAIQADPSLYVNESTTDALLVEAFESEMKGKKNYAKNCVHQGLLLQYCRKLGRDGVSLFFRKVGSGEPRAMQVFIDDVNSTYDRISKRCAAIIAERTEEEAGTKEQIQLVPTNPTTSITFEVPEGPPPENLEIKMENSIDGEGEGSGSGSGSGGEIDVEQVRKYLLDRWNTFNQFPKKLQKALKSKSLDKVNQVIGSMEIPQAEKIVHDLDRVGILCFSESGIIDKTKPPEQLNDDDNQNLDSTPQQIFIPDQTN